MTETHDSGTVPNQSVETVHVPARPDLVTLMLRTVAAGLLLVVLVFALMFVIYLKGLGAPRSAAERDIAQYRRAVEDQPGELLNHVRLAYAYSAADRIPDALETIERAEQMTDDERAVVQLAHADILRTAGRYDQAIRLYDKAETLATQEYEEAQQERADNRIFTDVPNEMLAGVLKGRAIAQWELGRKDDATADLAAAAEIIPTDASMLVTLGGFQAESGDTSAAAASYRRALEFVPDYADAIQGLRDLGVER